MVALFAWLIAYAIVRVIEVDYGVDGESRLGWALFLFFVVQGPAAFVGFVMLCRHWRDRLARKRASS